MRRLVAPLAVVLTIVTAVCVIDSLEWVDRPFAGFVLGRNRVVAPLGLARWTGLVADVPFGAVLTDADGETVASVPRLVERVWTLPVGTPVRYGFETRTGHVERTVEVMRFSAGDWLSFFGTWLVSGVMFAVLGLVVAYLKPGRPASQALLLLSVSWALTLVLSLGDFYRFHFRSLYALAQAAFPAAVVALSLTLPDRRPGRRGRWVLGALGVLTVLHAGADVALYDRAPHAWMRFFELSAFYFALAVLAASAMLVATYRRSRGDDRARIQLVALGAVLGFGVPAAIHLAARVVGVWVPVNLLPIATVIFPVAVGWAILTRNLYELDPLLTRATFYVVLTATVTIAYVLVLGAASAGNTLAPGWQSWVPFLFTLAVVAVMTPLRRGVQHAVDRYFFRVAYDSEAVVEATSRSLLAARDPREVAARIEGALDRTLGPEPLALLLPDGAGRMAAGAVAVGVHDPLMRQAGADGGVVPLATRREPAAEALRAQGFTLLLPLWTEGRLVGAVGLGPKRSGAPYGARDLALLRIVGNQAAVALENAASYAEVRQLTQALGRRVAERTADLERAHEALLAAQGDLARADKLASLGRLVAGVAHEINNPVAFINSSVDLIHEAGERLRAALGDRLDPEIRRTLDQLLENTVICRDGATRAARIVRDLGAFSRRAGTHREPVDLHAGLDRTLQLLRPQLGDRITVVRDYGAIPAPAADPGEIDQVLMNLLSNAAQAIKGPGEIRVRTYAVDGSVFLEVVDTGPGIDPAVQERIFEPFFTTKDGQGTGLGLAIAHSLVTRHGGDLAVHSAMGAGATFTVRLPVGGDTAA